MVDDNDSGQAPKQSEQYRNLTTITPTNRAIYEAGKAMLIQSVSTGREFCKFMIGTTLSAIPIYVALLKLAIPEGYAMLGTNMALALLPCILILASSAMFVWGYFPRSGTASLDIPEEIERERSAIVAKRHLLGISASGVFLVAILSCIAVLWLISSRVLLVPTSAVH